MPLDIVIVWLLRSEGAIPEVTVESCAQLHELQPFLLLGGCGPHISIEYTRGGTERPWQWIACGNV